MATLQLAIQASKAQQGASQFVAATGQVTSGAKSASAAVGTLNSQLASTGSVGLSVTRVVAGLFGAFHLYTEIRSAAKAFAEFEQEMAIFGAITKATTSEMRIAEDAALKLGSSTRYSATNAAEGLKILAKSGFGVAQSIESLPHVLDLAVANTLTLKDAAFYTTDVLHQFSLQTDQTGRVVDVMTAVAKKSQATLTDLGESLKFAGPAAGALRMPLEEVSAALGTLSDHGIKASLGGTNLRGIMLELINPTAKAKEVLHEMGLTVQDVDPRIHGLTGALQALANKGAGVSELGKIFGRLQVSGASALVQNIDRIKQLNKIANEAQGTARRLAEVMTDTTLGRWEQLGHLIEITAIQLGESGFGGAVKSVVIALTDGIRVLVGMEDTLVGNATVAHRVADAYRAIGIVLTVLIGLNVVGFFISLAANLTKTTTLVQVMNSQLLMTTAIFAALMGYDLGGWLYNEFKSVRGFGDDLAAAVQTAASEIEYYWDVMVAYLKKGWAEFVNYMLSKSDAVVGIVAGVMNAATPGAGSLFASSVAAGGIDYNMNDDLKKAQAARDSRQNDISVGYNAAQNEAAAQFGSKDRLTGDSYLAHMGESISDLTKKLNEQIKSWSGVTEATTQADEAMGHATSTTSTYAERIRDLSIFNEEAHEKAVKMVKDLNDEADAMNSSTRERTVLVKMLQFQAVAEEAYGEETERTIAILDQYRVALNKLEDARADKKFNESIRATKEEIAGLQLSTKERRIAAEVTKFHAEAEEAYGKGSERAAEKTAEFAKAQKELADALELRQLADNIGDAFGQAFTDMVFGAKSAREAVEGLTRAVIQLVFQQLVAKQLSTWISGGIMAGFGGASAKGNVFVGGSMVPFAMGGVVAGPTTFPMSGGRTGLMGENGPEAIMPLSRSASGKLGVEVTGHATKILNAQVTVVANNPNEYRGSERQMSNKLRALMQRM